MIYRSLFLLALLLCSHSLWGQEAKLTGRIEHANEDDVLQLYVMGTVSEKNIDILEDGTFSIGVDLLERSRAVLFWKGRTPDDWTCTFWLQPDSTLQLNLAARKVRRKMEFTAQFQGANAALSTYSNLYYQTFERENLLDSVYLAGYSTFADCQRYIEHTLQPIGEALMNLTPSDFLEGEEAPEQPLDEDDDTPSAATDDADDPFSSSSLSHLRSDEDYDEDDEEPQDHLEMARVELDYRQAQAEFTYAMLRERAGHHMEDDAAFQARLHELDYADPTQADAIAFMTAWRVVAYPQQFSPLTDEAARLRCLSQYVTDEDVRNEVAERIMQAFFLRVQMGEADPTSATAHVLYDEFRKVSSSDTYDDFITTQLDILEHPELYSDEPEPDPEAEDEDQEDDEEE